MTDGRNGVFKGLIGFTAGLGLALLMSSSMALAASQLIKIPDSQNENAPVRINIQAESVPFNFYDLKKKHVGRLTYLGGLELKSTDHRFGGLSGIRVSPDGEYLLALSDRGLWVSARLVYTNGRLAGVRDGLIAPLLDLSGKAVARHGKVNGDSEGFTEIPGSGLVVSFEGQNRLWHYGATLTDAVNQKRPRALPLPLDISHKISNLPSNGGIEALTTLNDGSLLTISENSRDRDGNVRGWLIGADGSTREIAYRARDGFKATDMATLPNGDVLVLERHLSLLGGLAARVRLIKQAHLYTGRPLSGKEIAELRFPFNIDNMEGLAVRRNKAGHTIVYMVSDNNYNSLQRTLLLMFRLEDHVPLPEPVQSAELQCRTCGRSVEVLLKPAPTRDGGGVSAIDPPAAVMSVETMKIETIDTGGLAGAVH